MTSDPHDIDLSDLELDILRMIVGNMSDCEIAFALDVEPRALEEMNGGLFSKLGASDRAAAADTALSLGLVKLEL